MATAINFASLLSFTGAGAAKRTSSFASIATIAMSEVSTRKDLIAACKVALGKEPTDAEVSAIRLQVQVGRVAANLKTKDVPAARRDDVLAFALDLITRYAAPPKEGTKARALKANQLGRRTVDQHRMVRASDEAWSKLAAEIGVGGAQTQAKADASKKTRAARMADTSAAAFGKVTAPSHSELVSADKPTTADDALAHIMAQASSLQAYANKHAGLIATDVGLAVNAFKSAMNKAANDYELRKAAAAENA